MDFSKYLEQKIKEKEKNQKELQKKKIKAKNEEIKNKIEILNTELRNKGIGFTFNIKPTQNGDGWEFDLPLNVLLGPKTRKYCNELWKTIMKNAGIEMDFADEIKNAIDKLDNYKVTMKINSSLDKEVGQGTISKE